MRTYQLVLAVALWCAFGFVSDSTAQSVPEVVTYQGVLADGAAVRSLNGATDAVSLTAGDNVTITQDEGALTISATGPEGGLSSVAAATLLAGDGTSAVPLWLPDASLSTTLLADNAVSTDKVQNEAITNAKLAPAAAVLSLNGLRGDITIQGAGGATVNSSGNTITINAGSGGGDGGIAGIQNTDNTLEILDPGGPTATINLRDGAITAEKLEPESVPAVDGRFLGYSAGESELRWIEPAVVTNETLTGDGTTGNALALAEAAVDTDQLADAAVTGAKIANGTLLRGRDIIVTSLTADGVTLSGGVTRQGGNDIAVTNPTATTLQIDFTGSTSEDAITAVNAGAGREASDDGDVTASGNSSTVRVQLADDAVNSAAVEDNSLMADDLARNAVGASELADGAVDAAAIQPGAVTVEKLDTADSPEDGNYLRFVDGEMRWTGLFGSEANTEPSSIRWKENVRPLANPVDLVEQLRGVRYDWTESGEADVGAIAEEVAAVLPELVEFDDGGQARGVHYAKLTAVLIEATKAQQQTIESKERTIQAPRREVGALEDRMARIERLLQSASGAAAAPPPGSDSRR